MRAKQEIYVLYDINDREVENACKIAWSELLPSLEWILEGLQ